MSDYMTYKVLVGAAIIVAACIYGFWRGFTGRSSEEGRDKRLE